MLTLLTILQAAAAACPAPVPLDRLDAALDEVEAAWLSLDSARYEAATSAFTAQLPCVASPASPPVAARIHRAEALIAWGAGDRERAAHALRSAHVLAPGWTPPEGWLPEGLQPSAGDLPPVRVNAPRDGSLWFDGAATNERPTDRATLLQWGAPGALAGTTWLAPADPLPDYGARRPLRSALFAAAAGSLVAGGGLYGAAFATRGPVDRPAGHTLDDLQRAQGVTNTLTVTGAGLGALAVGLAASALAVDR